MPGIPSSCILFSWIAKQNDPYQIHRQTGQRYPGPTLGLLFADDSPYNGHITDVVLFRRKGSTKAEKGEPDEAQIFRLLKQEIEDRATGIMVNERVWPHDDPTDYEAIHAFLQAEIPALRNQFAGRELVVHLSPGTPQMQTIWVLMAETGEIAPPVTLVKSYRPWERDGRPLAVPVRLNLRTLFKTVQTSRPAQVVAEDAGVIWNPAQFKSPRLLALYEEARRIARLNVPVLIMGERGTGKTTLASWIRANSPFRKPALDDAWPSVACGQYQGNSDLMRSELFGHVEGSFTGATRTRQGLLLKAHNETLFLDEIGDISREIQRLLIRALEEKRFYPTGSEEPQESNFRLITATNRPLDVLTQSLDADFWDRVSTFRLELPPLRQTPEDLPWLWDDVWQKALDRAGGHHISTSLPASSRTMILKALSGHPLPGNIRDLYKVAYRLAAALNDVDEEITARPIDEAVSYALQALEGADAGDQALSNAVVRAFIDQAPLDALFEAEGQIAFKDIIKDIQAYIAQQTLDYARRRRVAVDDICDYSRRRLDQLK